MKLIEHSNLLGYVVAMHKDLNMCLYFHADTLPSKDVTSAIYNLFGDVAITTTNNADTALSLCDALHINDTDYCVIKDAINEITAN